MSTSVVHILEVWEECSDICIENVAKIVESTYECKIRNRIQNQGLISVLEAGHYFHNCNGPPFKQIQCAV